MRSYYELVVFKRICINSLKFFGRGSFEFILKFSWVFKLEGYEKYLVLLVFIDFYRIFNWIIVESIGAWICDISLICFGIVFLLKFFLLVLIEKFFVIFMSLSLNEFCEYYVNKIK